MFKFGIFEPKEQVIDPMGSVIVNTNATGSPNFEWIYTSRFGGYGAPYKEVGSVLNYSDSVSYKIKLLNQIPKSANTVVSTSTTSNGLEYLSSDACYSTNTNVYNTCLNGPFRIGSKLYYIDFRVLYLVNLGDQPLYSPIFSVDTQKCNSDYGIFIGVPKVNLVAPGNLKVTSGLPNLSTIYSENPRYSNQVDLFNTDIQYKFTVLANSPNQDGSLTFTDVSINKNSLTSLIQNVAGIVDLDVPALGQTAIVAENRSDDPIVLPETKDSTVVLENGLQAGGFHPFVVFRYISSTAQTAPVEIAFTVAPNIG